MTDLLDPTLDYRTTPAPALGADPDLDRLAFAVCSLGGHIPHFTPSRPDAACDFHRRMAWAYARILRGQPQRFPAATEREAPE